MPQGIMPDSARQEKIATTYGLINRINPISETRQPIESVKLLTGQQCFLRRKTHPAGEPTTPARAYLIGIVIVGLDVAGAAVIVLKLTLNDKIGVIGSR